MQSHPDFMPWLYLVLMLIGGIGIVIYGLILTSLDSLRLGALHRAGADIQRWADRNGYLSLSQVRVWDSPFFKSGCGQLVFRVVALDQRFDRKVAWILTGDRFQLRWGKPDDWPAVPAARSSSPD